MKNFFKTIPRTVWSPGFYRDVLANASLKRAFGYFFGLVALIALVGSVIGASSFLSFIEKAGIPTIIENAVLKYPADYVFEVKDGVASSSRATPITLSSTQLGLPTDACPDTTAPCTLLTIDTSRNPSLDEVLASGNVAWIGKNFGYSVSEKGHVEAQSFASYNDFVLNKARVVELAGYVETLLNHAYPYLAVIFFIFAFVIFLLSIVGALFAALVLLALSKLLKWPYSYQSLFVASLYASTLPILLSLPALFVALQIPGLFSVLIVLIIVLLNIHAGKNEVTVTPVEGSN